MRQLRYLPRPGSLVEITNKTVQDRYLLRPSPELNLRIAGVLARAQERSGMRIHAVVFLSNHYHLLISPDSVQQMADFMCHVGTNLSKEVKKLHRWDGPVFTERYASIPVSDEEEAQVARLRYLLSQGTKENLVMAPREWPGLQTVEALTTSKPICGIWVERTKLWAARQRGEPVTESDCSRDLELEISPIPCWAHIDSKIYRHRVIEIVEQIERETEKRHRRDGTEPAGTSHVLAQHPHRRSTLATRSPRPAFHAACSDVRQLLLAAYREFVAAYREAATRLKDGALDVAFPPDCFPPRLPFVPPNVLLEPG